MALPQAPVLRPGQVVLLDIEGTTTPITFVQDSLFPFARRHVRQHLLDTWDAAETQEDVAALLELARQDGEEVEPQAEREETVAFLVRFVHSCMDQDRKVTALKQLQGHIWRAGYHLGELKGELFPDVPAFLQGCQTAGIPVSIYSSGSVPAQKLLFGHSEHGDLLPLLCSHFDTEVGGKREASSYRAICDSLGIEPSALVFLTDIFEEAVACREAGGNAVLSVRKGNAPLTEEQRSQFPCVEEFSCLLPP